jgi:hypothetical protein
VTGGALARHSRLGRIGLSQPGPGRWAHDLRRRIAKHPAKTADQSIRATAHDAVYSSLVPANFTPPDLSVPLKAGSPVIYDLDVN